MDKHHVVLRFHHWVKKSAASERMTNELNGKVQQCMHYLGCWAGHTKQQDK